jgi:Family of unknown function (DUF5995)
MFPYDPLLSTTIARTPQSISEVLTTLEAIQTICEDGDGLKWFNWLYLQVTLAVKNRIDGGGFIDPVWLTKLDVQFASLYLSALESYLLGNQTPDCWQTLFVNRDQARIARIQFALTGINAHITHDLPEAIVTTAEASGIVPTYGIPEFQDYTSLNSTLDGIVESAKRTLHVRLLGDALPPVSHLEDLIAGWGVSAARDAAWNNAELLWNLRLSPPLSNAFMATLDGLTTVTNKALLVPVP